ncbi:hypothetical protein GCM10010448_20630 [Streptomyces glomeratus]|uniref:Uncharacterized protein n=1 Tax=Streptomyces glomeratus TaxID=284452 RepID=A0ABP6LEA3_9ACTN
MPYVAEARRRADGRRRMVVAGPKSVAGPAGRAVASDGSASRVPALTIVIRLPVLPALPQDRRMPLPAPALPPTSAAARSGRGRQQFGRPRRLSPPRS